MRRQGSRTRTFQFGLGAVPSRVLDERPRALTCFFRHLNQGPAFWLSVYDPPPAPFADGPSAPERVPLAHVRDVVLFEPEEVRRQIVCGAGRPGRGHEFVADPKIGDGEDAEGGDRVREKWGSEGERPHAVLLESAGA